MATYAIGDVQGCFLSLQALLDKLAFDPRRDELWLLGDLVGRGPGALEVLRFVALHPRNVHVLLGNHDLALLGYGLKLADAPEDANLEAVLTADDAPKLLANLRRRPLVAEVGNFLLVHAGFLPTWTRATVRRRAAHAAHVLRGVEGPALLAQFLRRDGVFLADAGEDRLQASTADVMHACASLQVLTCLRTLDAHGQPDARFKGTLAALPTGNVPWFRWPKRCLEDVPIAFGHWSALGAHQEGTAHALDGGCVWGGELCALSLPDARLTRQPSCEVTRVARPGGQIGA